MSIRDINWENSRVEIDGNFCKVSVPYLGKYTFKYNDNSVQDICKPIFQGSISQQEKLLEILTNSNKLKLSEFKIVPDAIKVNFLAMRYLLTCRNKEVIDFIDQKAFELKKFSNMIEEICNPIFDNEKYTKEEQKKFINTLKSKEILSKESLLKELISNIIITRSLLGKNTHINNYINDHEIFLNSITLKPFIHPELQIPVLPPIKELLSQQ